MEKQNRPDALDRALTDLYRAEIPKDYRAAWRAAVQREEQTAMKKHWNAKTVRRVALSAAAALVLVVGALSAGSLIPTVMTDTLYGAPSPRAESPQLDLNTAMKGNASPTLSMEAASDNSYAMSAQAPAGGGDMAVAPSRSAGDEASQGTDTGAAQQTGAKIVRTADLTIATTDYDADNDAVKRLTQSLGGYVASVSLYGEPSSRNDRVAYYTLRIPSDKLAAFLEGMGGIGRITARSETATDMTTQYSDTQLRLSTQQAKMERLQALLKQAADVSDLLEIETEIADTQYALDSLESSLRTIDRDVDNSEVTLTLREESSGETAQATELTLWQRLGSGFEASVKGLGAFFQNLLVFLAMLLPALVPLAVVAAVVIVLVRRRRRNRAIQADQPAAAPMAPAAPAGTTPADSAADKTEQTGR